PSPVAAFRRLLCAAESGLVMDWRLAAPLFKQKTAYAMTSSLVGSEMCIRDRTRTDATTRENSLLKAFM
ncbi:hypothetical protein ACX3VG_03490, partial [Escherichia coli]